jgi:hypothetical protein
MKIIGLGHYSRTGKDSFANYLVQNLLSTDLRVVKRPFAWKLKEVAHDLYAWAGMREPEFYETPEGAIARDVVLPALEMTPVEVWVKLGTPAIREQVYDKTWIDYVLKGTRDTDILIIPDVRFPNEIEAIREAGGTAIKVVRPGYGPRNTVADRKLLGYAGWDYVIGGEGTMTSLNRWAATFALYYIGHGPRPVQSEADRQQALAVEKL